jgi:hypothetical protein
MATEILDDGSLYAQNKLGMVNQCLLAIGEVPLAEGTVLAQLQQGTDGAIARDIVASTLLEVLNRGWFFNTDHDFPFMPDTDDFITFPPNLLRIDAGRTKNRKKVVKRGNRLYNLETQDFKFTEVTYLDAVWVTSYEDLPQQVYQYIALRAARRFQQSVIGSSDLYRFTAQDELDALVNAQREDLQYRDVNLLSTRVLNSKVPKWGDQ